MNPDEKWITVPDTCRIGMNQNEHVETIKLGDSFYLLFFFKHFNDDELVKVALTRFTLRCSSKFCRAQHSRWKS